MLKANFNITETGGTGHVRLQGSTDGGNTWTDIGTTLALTQGARTLTDTDDIEIDTASYIPGSAYQFRLVDVAGIPISSVVSYTIPSIQHYAAGSGMIGFAHTGGDNYAITFYATPTGFYATDGATVTGMEYQVYLWHALTYDDVADSPSPQTTDQTVTASGHGAGIYECKATYDLSNGLSFVIARYVKVDASGNILADIQANGTTSISVSGLDMTEAASFIQSGVNYPIVWGAFDGNNVSQLASGATATFTVPPGTLIVFAHIQLDSVFQDDFGGDLAGYVHTVSVS